MGRVVSTSEARHALKPQFPELTDSNFSITSEQTWDYNCIAWAAGDSSRWWWPMIGYWPISNQAEEVSAFKEAFASLGYTETEDLDKADRFERVAIFAKDGKPTHAARQLENGQWTSKLGPSWDISHEFDALNNGFYGNPVLIMERERK